MTQQPRVDSTDNSDNRNSEEESDIDVLRCMYTNNDNLANKRNEIRANIELQKPDIIAITEILPNDKGDRIQGAEFEIHDYDCFQNGSNGRGVCIYLRKSLNAIQVYDLCSHNFNESMWCEVRPADSDRLLIGSIYRSPN